MIHLSRTQLQCLWITPFRAYQQHQYSWHYMRSTTSSSTNMSILFFGNSHTRQTANSLLCQYQDELISLTPRLNGKEGYSAVFTHGIVVEAVINNYAVFGKEWQKLMEGELNHTLASFDALVLGKFNRLLDSYNTTFYQEMEKISNERDNVGFFNVKPPPWHKWRLSTVVPLWRSACFPTGKRM